MNLAKKLELKTKHFTAEHLFSMIKEKKLQYEDVMAFDPKRFQNLEYTMRLIFNHDEDMHFQVTDQQEFEGSRLQKEEVIEK